MNSPLFQLRRLLRNLSFVAVLSGGCCSAALAQTASLPVGFSALFNGKDLSGWYGWSTRDPKELWAMTPEETFGQLLGLGKAWRVVEARLEASSSTFVLKVEETAALWPEESARAGTPVTCHDHVEPMQWRHLNVFQHRCEITCRLPRGKCRQCGHVFRVRPPWERYRM